MKDRVLVILGPTATGKSRIAMMVVEKLNGEIISGDSMLVYRGMDIGTAKPSKEEMARVPHHLVDILPPNAEFNVFDFKNRAEVLIREINARGRLPVIAGGTGLYIKALLENYAFNDVGARDKVRSSLEKISDKEESVALHGKLAAIDGEAVARLHPNNTRRIIRAMESAIAGENVGHDAEEPMFDALVFGLSMKRDVLYGRIEARVDAMLEAGLEREVRNLLKKGFTGRCQSMRSIGYRQMRWYIEDNMPYAEAVAKLKQATRNFAKRQVTWYKKMPYIRWLELKAPSDYNDAAAIICAAARDKWQ